MIHLRRGSDAREVTFHGGNSALHNLLRCGKPVVKEEESRHSAWGDPTIGGPPYFLTVRGGIGKEGKARIGEGNTKGALLEALLNLQRKTKIAGSKKYSSARIKLKGRRQNHKRSWSSGSPV